MLDYVIALILLLLSSIGVVLLRTYFAIPLMELKRQASKGDKLGSILFRAAAFDSDLKILLWFWVGICSAVEFVLLTRVAPEAIGIVVIILVILVTFAWLPAKGLTSIGVRLVILCNPVLVFVLNWAHPIIGRISAPFHARLKGLDHTSLYESSDLIELLENQATQSDNRVPLEDLEIAKNALMFSGRKLSDFIVPRKKVKTIRADDSVSPVLVDELHASGHQHFPVLDDTKNIVGILSMRKINRLSSIKKGGLVRQYMDDSVAYVHEDDSPNEVIETFFKTREQLFIVVNSSEEYLGIVLLDDVLLGLLGARIGSDFTQFDDLKAVAAKNHNASINQEDETDSLETITEIDETVVE